MKEEFFFSVYEKIGGAKVKIFIPMSKKCDGMS